MRWSRSELERLYPILEQVTSDLAPVDGKQVLVLSSATGEVAFWLAEMMESGKVTGLELDAESLELAKRSAHEIGLEAVVSFQAAGMDQIPLPEASCDAVVSESILYPSLMPTTIDLPEVKRVLKPGGRLVLTEVIATKPIPLTEQRALQSIGLDELFPSTPEDVQARLAAAGLVNIKSLDLTSTVRAAWEMRRGTDRSPGHWIGYSTLLEDSELALGKSIFYITLRADKPK